MLKNEGIVFRNRPLFPGEKYHYHCKKCNRDLHPDKVKDHKCDDILTQKGNW